MSRLSKKSLFIPQDIKAELSGNKFIAEGPKGKLARDLGAPNLSIEIKEGRIMLLGNFNKKSVRSRAGLIFALINNMFQGVREGFIKQLEIVGVGYNAQVQGKNLNLRLGFSHPVVFPVPPEIKIVIPKPTQITIEGLDKELVGNTAAQIRAIFPPEPYKGKGIRYANEIVRRKLGKAVTK